jgi:hypothetical protein
MDFILVNGKIVQLSDEELKKLQMKAISVEDAVKNMTPEQLEKFKKERYEKFIKPLIGPTIGVKPIKVEDNEISIQRAKREIQNARKRGQKVSYDLSSIGKGERKSQIIKLLNKL